MNKTIGKITSVQGNMITVSFDDDIIQNEVGYVLTGSERLMAEVIRISANIANMQVFEDTKGIKIGDKVEAESVVCVIEAMKVLNEIKAEKSGVVKEILVENAQSVEYGWPLFVLE